MKKLIIILVLIFSTLSAYCETDSWPINGEFNGYDEILIEEDKDLRNLCQECIWSLYCLRPEVKDTIYVGYAVHDDFLGEYVGYTFSDDNSSVIVIKRGCADKRLMLHELAHALIQEQTHQLGISKNHDCPEWYKMRCDIIDLCGVDILNH